MYDQVVSVLCNLKFIEKKAIFGMTYELINDFQRLEPELPDNYRERVEPYNDFLLANVHVITMFPKLVIQQAVNLPTSNIVTSAASGNSPVITRNFKNS